MIYKPEHVVDLETGAILDADVRPGDAPDTEDLTDRVLETEARVNQALGDPKDTGRVECVAADTGYFKLAEIELLQGVGIQTVIPDSQKRTGGSTGSPTRSGPVLDSARQTVTSEAGKLLGRRRSELVERGFEHVLDCGAARRTTLRGRENIRKRYLIRAMGANLSLLMRHPTGVGTPKQALAAPERVLTVIFEALLSALVGIWTLILRWRPVEAAILAVGR
jgi:transposase